MVIRVGKITEVKVDGTGEILQKMKIHGTAKVGDNLIK